MPVNVVRLRKWLAAAAIVLVAVVAATYFYGRWKVYRSVREVPRKLASDVKQSTEGFELSRSEGGRTIFVVRASRAVQYQPGGRAELRDVLILVYGRRSNRFDQIYGERFEYDPESGTVSAKGTVHIDLEGNAEGPVAPDQSQPVELKNPIHLETSGLVFNQRTGIARTDERVEFRTRQANGSAQGAVYNSEQATLTLQSDVQFHSAGANPADIQARRATITRNPYRAVLESVDIKRPSGNMKSDRLTILFRDNNTVERLIAEGNVQAGAKAGSQIAVRAPRAEAPITEDSRLQSALLSGGVSFEAMGASNMQGSANRVALNFSGGNLSSVVASEAVRLVQAPAGSGGQVRHAELSAPEVTLGFDGQSIRRADTSGLTELLFTQPEGNGTRRTAATVGKLAAQFDAQGRIRHVSGTDHAQIAATRPGHPDQISTSDTAEAELSPAGAIVSLIQSGNFEYREGPGLANTPNPSQASIKRAAFAQQARFVASEDKLLLTGSPRLEQGGISTTARTITIAGRSGEALAEGEVKTTYSQLKAQPGGALLASSAPVHVTAAIMTATQAGGVAIYRGAARSGSQASSGVGLARLWQGANAIQAPIIEFHSEQREVLARSGEARALNPAVSTVLVQQDRTGKVTPVRIAARSLSYVDSEHRVRFEGGVEVRGADTVIEASQVDVVLQPSGQNRTPASPGAPSQIERVAASGGVTVRQGERRAQGETLVYVIDNKSFTINGQPASIFDAERGQIRANSLTFYSRNDTVQVEGGSSPAVTQTRVAK